MECGGAPSLSECCNVNSEDRVWDPLYELRSLALLLAPTHKPLSGLLSLVYKMRGYVAKDQRVIVLTGLVSNNAGIAAVRGAEFVLSDVSDPS